MREAPRGDGASGCSAGGGGRHCEAVLPVMFSVPGLGWEIHAYGSILALALLVAWVVTLSLGRKDRLPPGRLGMAFVLGVGTGVLAARVVWLLQRPAAEASAEPLWALRGDQLAPFAGVLVAAMVMGIYAMRRRVPVVAVFDVVAPGLMAGAMVERLGALAAGIGFGDVAPELPWALRFPVGSPAFVEHQRTLAELLPPDATQSLPVHPTQVYALLLAGVTLAVALAVRRRRRFSGQVLLATGITYLLLRTLVEEWFRADAGTPTMGPLNGGQLGGLVVAGSMGVVLWSRGRLAAVKPEAFRPWEGGRWSPPDQRPGAGRGAGAATADGAMAAGPGVGRGGASKAGGSRGGVSRGGAGKRKRKARGKGKKRR